MKSGQLIQILSLYCLRRFGPAVPESGGQKT